MVAVETKNSENIENIEPFPNVSTEAATWEGKPEILVTETWRKDKDPPRLRFSAPSAVIWHGSSACNARGAEEKEIGIGYWTTMRPILAIAMGVPDSSLHRLPGIAIGACHSSILECLL